MRKIFLGLFCLSLIFSLQPSGHAASTSLTWDGSGGPGSMGLDVDDNGGYDDDYDFTFNGDGHTSTTDFIVSDGTGMAVGDSDLTTADFLGNGLSIFNGPFPNFPNVDQIVLETDTPFTPITMSVNNTNLTLQEIVYVNNTKDYAIIELRGVNNAATASPIFLAVANDWDLTNGDDANGFDSARGLVFQYSDFAPEHYSIGMASLNNAVDQYHLGSCCGLTNVIDNDPLYADPYVLQRHFLNNTKPTEECDDGGDAPADGSGDTCSPKCHNAVAGQVCGNNIIEGDEECDDNNLTNGDGCDDRCLDENSLCGNGSLDAGEECDDNNRINGDGCDLDCKAEFSYNDDDYCGDGLVNNGATGQQVDPSVASGNDNESALSVKFASVAPNQGATAAFCIVGATGTDQTSSETSLKSKTDDCLAFYQQNIAVCGNGVQNAGEDCDDGNLVDGDGCDSNCTLTSCGNDILNTGEACDDGNIADGDGCSSACQIETTATCGDGVVDAGEACDDGNTNNNDSCTNACTVSSGGFQFQGSGCGLSGTTESTSAFFSLLPFLGAGLLALRRRFR